MTLLWRDIRGSRDRGHWVNLSKAPSGIICASEQSLGTTFCLRLLVECFASDVLAHLNLCDFFNLPVRSPSVITVPSVSLRPACRQSWDPSDLAPAYLAWGGGVLVLAPVIFCQDRSDHFLTCFLVSRPYSTHPFGETPLQVDDGAFEAKRS